MAEKGTASQMALESVPVKTFGSEELLNHIRKTYDAIERRAFEIFENNGGKFGHDREDWFKAEIELLHPVPVRIVDSDNALTVEAEVPGFDAKQLQIILDPEKLTITGKKESREAEKERTTFHTKECANEILRVVALPAEVEASKTVAALKNGVLELQMPKRVKTKAARGELNAT